MTTSAFISYTHESDEHRRQVMLLSQQLRVFGVDCWLDQYDEVPPPDSWPRWMFGQIDSAEFVLVICTETYRRRVEGREQPGVGLGANWEGAIVTQELYERPPGSPVKFIPVLIGTASAEDVPYFLRGTTRYHLDVHQSSDYQPLLEVLLGRPRVVPAPIGAPPADLASLQFEPPEGTIFTTSPDAQPPDKPDDSLTYTAGLPDSVDLAELLGGGTLLPGVLSNRWATAPETAPVPLGRGKHGVVAWDPVTEGPHALVAGTTGSGKSALLQTMLASIAAIYPPDTWQFVLVDLKGGAAFMPLQELPHALAVLSDLDNHVIRRTQELLYAELRSRQEHLMRLGFSSYDKIPPEARERSPLPRLMIVVDEFAALTREHPDFLELLVAVGRIGRSLGIHLVMATQRASAIPDSLMATLNARFVLRTADRADSVAALGDASAGTLTPRLPGRAFKSTHGSRPVPFQVAYGGDWLEEVVKAANYASLKRPQTWLEAAISWSGLPSKIEADAAGKPGLVALVDDRQRMIIRPWLLGPDSIGSLHIIGTRGSGKSGTLITMVRAFCRSVAADGIDLYVVGFRGGERLRALGSLSQVRFLGGHDRADHVARVVQLAATEARRRKLATSLRESLVISSADEPLTNPGRPLVVAIDDCHLLTHERPELAEPLAELASCDPTTGVALLLSTDFGGASATYCKTLERRLVLRLSDPMDYSKFGIQVDELPTMPPIGRGILQPGQHEVQVVSPGDW